LWLNAKTDTLQRGLRTSEDQLVALGRTAKETFNLREELDLDGLSNNKPYAYIEKQMVDSRIGKKFNIQTQDGEVGQGWSTKHYLLAPSNNEIDFDRRQVGTFLLYLQGNTTRMKVTRLRLDLSSRRGAGPDDWKATLTVTDRYPDSAEG
jgi:hypothetical protein